MSNLLRTLELIEELYGVGDLSFGSPRHQATVLVLRSYVLRHDARYRQVDQPDMWLVVDAVLHTATTAASLLALLVEDEQRAHFRPRNL